MNNPPEKTARIIRVKAHVNRVTEIKVVRKRDPRGADNNIYIWIDEKDQLHIRVLKPERCYKYAHEFNRHGYYEVVQV